jgi:two-component system sensor histidine kinase KdpD
VLSIALPDVLFVPVLPSPCDTEYYFTFVLMFAVALTMGGLTSRVREQAEEAREQAARVAALYDLDRELSKTDRVAEVLSIATAHLGRTVGGQAVVLLVPEGTAAAWPESGVFQDVSVRAAATMALRDGFLPGRRQRAPRAQMRW